MRNYLKKVFMENNEFCLIVGINETEVLYICPEITKFKILKTNHEILDNIISEANIMSEYHPEYNIETFKRYLKFCKNTFHFTMFQIDHGEYCEIFEENNFLFKVWYDPVYQREKIKSNLTSGLVYLYSKFSPVKLQIGKKYSYIAGFVKDLSNKCFIDVTYVEEFKGFENE